MTQKRLTKNGNPERLDSAEASKQANSLKKILSQEEALLSYGDMIDQEEALLADLLQEETAESK